jgi:hypothetical protein
MCTINFRSSNERFYELRVESTGAGLRGLCVL